jgi:O-antigen/teichoic acid export membrane protein
MAITSAAYFIVISSLSNVIPNVTSIEQYISITQYIIISIIVAFLFALNQIILTFHQYEKNPREILKIQIIISSIILLATLLFLITFEMNWLSRIYGIVIAYSIGLLYMFHRTGYKFLSVSSFHFEKYSGLLSQSLPIIISSLFVFFIMNIDKYFIEKIFGLYDFGLYAFGTSLNQLIFFIAIAINKVTGPYLLDQIKLKNLRFIYMIIASISVLLVIVSVAYYYLIIFFYDSLFDQSYKSFFEFYSLQMVILVLLQVSSFFTFLITTQKRTYLLAFINMLFVLTLVFTLNLLEYETISGFLEVYLIIICIYIILLNILFYIPFRKSH